MNEPTSPRAARSREKMLRAATDLLVESGSRAVTVDAVAERSGVAKSTLYRHWPSRDEMLIEAVRWNIPDVGGPDEALGFDAGLRQYIRDTAATLGDPEWSRIIPALMSLRTTMPELAAFVETDHSSKNDVLQALLDRGVGEGSLPEGIDVEDAAALLFGPLLFTAITGDRDRLERLATVVVDRFLASHRA